MTLNRRYGRPASWPAGPEDSEPFKQGCRQIALGERGDDDDNRLAGVFRPPPDVDRRSDGGAGRNTDGNTLDARNEPGGVESRLIANRDDLVDHRAIEDRGDEAGADPLGLVRAGRAAGEDRRVFRLDRDHADARLPRLEHLADAGDRAASADARDNKVDLAVGVVPDLLGRRPAVN